MSAVEGWKTESLGRVAQITMGQSPDSKYYSEEKNGLPFLQGCAEFTSRFPKHALYCSQTKKVANTGSILFSVRAPVGKINLADRDYIIGRGLAAISGIEVDQTYLEHYLKYVESRFHNASQGSTFEAINSSELNRWPIEHPTSRPEQAKIAEILSTVDRAIEQTEALIAKHQRIKTGLMQDLLTRGIDEHGNLRSEQTHKFKDSPLGRIPVEWETKELRSYLSYLSYGFTNPMPEAKDGPYMVTAANVANGFVQYDHCRRTTIEAYEKLLTKKSRPEIGDILITKDGTLGRLAIVDRLPLCINQSVAVMRPKDGVDNSYLKLLLESPEYQKRIADDAGGSTIKHIYISKIGKMLIAIPNIRAEQEAIKERLLSQTDLLYQYEATNRKIQSLKTALMQDLLTGKKRVNTLMEKILCNHQ